MLCKQKEQYSNTEKFLQAADVNSSMLEKNREKNVLEKELKELNKAESKSKRKLSKKRRYEVPHENTKHGVDPNESAGSTDVCISSDSSHSTENDPTIPPLVRENAIAPMIYGSTVAAPESVQDFPEAPKL